MTAVTEQWLPQDHMVDHPQGGYSALWNGPHVVDIGLPDGQSLRFAVAALPISSWTPLFDQQHQPLPIAIMMDGGTMRIAWADIDAPTGQSPPGHAADPRAQLERDRSAAAALSAGSTAVYQAGIDASMTSSGWKRR